MFKFEFCLPTTGKSVPAGPEWFHEIKFDGYRLRLERDGDRVRLITKGGYDCTKRYPTQEPAQPFCDRRWGNRPWHRRLFRLQRVAFEQTINSFLRVGRVSVFCEETWDGPLHIRRNSRRSFDFAAGFAELRRFKAAAPGVRARSKHTTR
jgi:hypothetical protein